MLPIESYKRISKKITVQKDDINFFDWKYYTSIHKDLYQNGITTKEQAYKHWISHGKNENRLHRFMNNLEMYIDNIKDLINTNHINKEKAWDLLDDFTTISDNINNEQIKMIIDNENEKRLNKYKDKKHLDYIEHATFLNFDWEFYIENNKDLIIHKINNKEKAWKHWSTYGKYENRRFKLIENDTVNENSFQNDKYILSHEKNKNIGIKSISNDKINTDFISTDKINIYEEQQVKNYYLNDNYNFNSTADNKVYHNKIIKDRIIKDKILKYSISKNNSSKNRFVNNDRNTPPKIIDNTVSKTQILYNKNTKNKLIKPKITNENNLLEDKKELEKNKKITFHTIHNSTNSLTNSITKNKLDKKIVINEENENNILNEKNKIENEILQETEIITPTMLVKNNETPLVIEIQNNNLDSIESNIKEQNKIEQPITDIITSNEKVIIENKKKLKNNKIKLNEKIDNEILFNKIISNIVNNKIINSKRKINKIIV